MAKWVNLDDCIEISAGEMRFYPVELLGDVYEEVAPVIHARWKFGKCTKCGGDAPFWCMASTYRASSYCPDCGAKMDEAVDA